MLTKEIENLKEQLDSMISSENFTYTEILHVSQQLDVLIVKYIRENN